MEELKREKNTEHNLAPDNKEYEFALSLLQYHTQLLWQTFGSFLLIETVLIGFIGAIFTSRIQNDPSSTILIQVISVIGAIICFPWYSTAHHNYQYYLLRIFQARQLEPNLNYKFLMQGKELSSGHTIKIDKEEVRLSRPALWLPPRKAINLIILVFFIAFVLTAVISVLPVP